MLKKLSWSSFFLSLILALIPAIIVGVFFGVLGWALFIATLALLGWNYYQQLKLSNWLWRDNSLTPPTARGNWEVIFYGLLQLQRRNKKRRKELATLIKRFRSGAESLPDALVMMTDEGMIFWCNGLAEDLLSFRWPEDNGQNIQNLLRYPELSEYLEKNDFSRPLILLLHDERHVEFRIMPYNEGQLIMIARDVSARKQMEVARRNFFNNASHELGTPLTVLKGYLEMMDENALHGILPPNALIAMRQQTDRMDHLVKQLLTLSRLEYQTQAHHKTRVNLSSLLESVKLSVNAMLLPNEQQAEKKISFEIAPEIFAEANLEEIRGCMNNLIENAIKHTPENSTIHVSLHPIENNHSVIFSVTDDGDGIAEMHLANLTERFYRVDSGRSRNTGGSGIGLAIVKHALQHHNSQLEIESKLGKGSTFSFQLERCD